MPVDSISTMAPLSRLAPLAPPETLRLDVGPGMSLGESGNVAGGAAAIFKHFLAESQEANAAATAAIEDLATGRAQDLSSVTLAVSQADLSFRFILELRNRLSDALQEITRMQV